jgi:hypothetical protein
MWISSGCSDDEFSASLGGCLRNGQFLETAGALNGPSGFTRSGLQMLAAVRAGELELTDGVHTQTISQACANSNADLQALVRPVSE